MICRKKTNHKAKSAEDKGEFVARWQTPSSDYSVSDDAHVFLPVDDGYFWSSSLNEGDEGDCEKLTPK